MNYKSMFQTRKPSSLRAKKVKDGEAVNRRVQNQLSVSFYCCQSTSLGERFRAGKPEQIDAESRSAFEW